MFPLQAESDPFHVLDSAILHVFDNVVAYAGLVCTNRDESVPTVLKLLNKTDNRGVRSFKRLYLEVPKKKSVIYGSNDSEDCVVSVFAEV
jgi:hypothetical protein